MAVSTSPEAIVKASITFFLLYPMLINSETEASGNTDDVVVVTVVEILEYGMDGWEGRRGGGGGGGAPDEAEPMFS